MTGLKYRAGHRSSHLSRETGRPDSSTPSRGALRVSCAPLGWSLSGYKAHTLGYYYRGSIKDVSPYEVSNGLAESPEKVINFDESVFVRLNASVAVRIVNRLELERCEVFSPLVN